MVRRRDFLKTMSMASAGLALGAGDLLHAQTISPKKGRGDKVKIAYIGIGNRGEQIIEDFARTGMVEVVALCDVDMGAKHTQKIMAKYPKAKQFRDFRQMFDKAGNEFDAVAIATPDHSHFPISMLALASGKHVYVEKPLARTFYEAELLMQAALKRPNLVTQVGNQGHSEANYFQFKAWMDAGIIKDVIAITSATPAVFGFDEETRKIAGKQFVDVGIAEETAVALASGIAAGGGKPVYPVYSTFIQRAFDQLSQDLCINNNAATLVVFAASVFGMNDVTHLGIYDIPMMSNIPNLVYLAPTTKEEYLAMLDWSVEQNEHPVAIRIPCCEFISNGEKITKDFSKLNKYEVGQQGSDVAFIGLGSFYPLAKEAAKLYEEKTGTKATVINPYYITGVDTGLLEGLKKNHSVVVTLEDGILDGGFGEHPECHRRQKRYRH